MFVERAVIDHIPASDVLRARTGNNFAEMAPRFVPDSFPTTGRIRRRIQGCGSGSAIEVKTKVA